MILPLFLLAAGAIFSGALGYQLFVGDGMVMFWGDSIRMLPQHSALIDAHNVPVWVKVLPILVGAGGIGLAYWMYMMRPDIPALLAAKLRPAYLLSYNKWYFDEIYERIFVRPAFVLGRGFWKAGDEALIDGVGPDGIAATTLRFARRASALQSGYLYHYAFAMLIGVVVLITWYFFTRTAG